VTQIGDTLDLVSNQLQTLHNLVVPLNEFVADPIKLSSISKEDVRTQYIKQDVQRHLRLFTEQDINDQVIHDMVRHELVEKTHQIATLTDLQVKNAKKHHRVYLTIFLTFNL
jgi:hypothetical protein